MFINLDIALNSIVGRSVDVLHDCVDLLERRLIGLVIEIAN